MSNPVHLERRHFNFIADVVADLGFIFYDDTHRWVVEHFARRLAATNEQFDRDRFIAASGVS